MDCRRLCRSDEQTHPFRPSKKASAQEMQVLKEIFQEYDEQFKFHEGLPLANWPCIVGAIVAYLAIIGFGRDLMQNKNKFELKGIVPLHNAILCIWSVAMVVGITKELLSIAVHGGQEGNFITFFCDPERRLAKGKQVWWFYIFFLSKYYELLDTVIIVLKKRPLIFLHVYHHCITLVLTFVMLQNNTGAQWLAITANACVHIPMYFYYAMSSIGYQPWWKKYMTEFQTVQFIADLTANSIGFYYFYNGVDCAGAIGSWIFGQAVLLSFLILFINFYQTTYTAALQNKKKTT